MKIYTNLFKRIISLENLFLAWDKFKADKQTKSDVQEFAFCLEKNIFQLHKDLKSGNYTHGSYTSFYIHDPKLRHIHKAEVRDRVFHHAVFQILNPLFEPTFIATSFSCRVNKGTHKGVECVEKMLRVVSKNYTKPCFVLKCDVKKFFDSVDHDILLNILGRTVKDDVVMRLMKEIVESFSSGRSTLFRWCGIPIGNLTSQLFANVYMNEFDHFVKHELKVKYYARYTDDFVIIHNDIKYLKGLISKINIFLHDNLRLALHPGKVSINKASRGVDFLGYIIFPYHKMVRTKTKNRVFRKLRQKIRVYKVGELPEESLEQTLNSYLGVFSHANAFGLGEKLKNQYWFWINE
ncbi:MAG: reverse transcriptase domain-containing protein [Candidatus Komeilibacteria bacterium]